MFIHSVRSAIDRCIPIKVIRRGKRDPDYITPLVKSLLRKRSKLRKHGHIEEASALAEKINDIICVNRSNRMAKLTEASPKELWAAARNGGNGSGSHVSQRLLSNPDLVNEL